MNALALRSFLAIVLLLLPAVLGAFAPALVWQAATEIARGRGERGPWQQNDSRYDFVDDPSVAIDDRGNVAVVWVDQAAKDVLFQRFAADGSEAAGPAGQCVARSPDFFLAAARCDRTRRAGHDLRAVAGDHFLGRLAWRRHPVRQVR